MSKKEWHVIGQGFAGWHAIGVNVRSSGGQLVYDASKADPAAFTKHVISGPMVDPSLGLLESNRYSKENRENAAKMQPGLGG